MRLAALPGTHDNFMLLTAAGGIKMLPSKNNRDDFVAFNFSNMKQLLRAVTVNNLAFTRSNFG